MVFLNCSREPLNFHCFSSWGKLQPSESFFWWLHFPLAFCRDSIFSPSLFGKKVMYPPRSLKAGRSPVNVSFGVNIVRTCYPQVRFGQLENNFGREWEVQRVFEQHFSMTWSCFFVKGALRMNGNLNCNWFTMAWNEYYSILQWRKSGLRDSKAYAWCLCQSEFGHARIRLMRMKGRGSHL